MQNVLLNIKDFSLKLYNIYLKFIIEKMQSLENCIYHKNSHKKSFLIFSFLGFIVI